MKCDMEEIYKEHAGCVYKYLLSLTHDDKLAEELTQETFYRAVYSIGSYNGTCKVSVWLCQIAKHIWYQELEKKKKLHTEEMPEDLISTDLSPEDNYILRGEKISLYKAIMSLESPMRDVVLMRLSGEFDFAEIGEVIGKTENWVRTTFYRAKQKLIREFKL